MYRWLKDLENLYNNILQCRTTRCRKIISCDKVF